MVPLRAQPRLIPDIMRVAMVCWSWLICTRNCRCRAERVFPFDRRQSYAFQDAGLRGHSVAHIQV